MKKLLVTILFAFGLFLPLHFSLANITGSNNDWSSENLLHGNYPCTSQNAVNCFMGWTYSPTESYTLESVNVALQALDPDTLTDDFIFSIREDNMATGNVISNGTLSASQIPVYTSGALLTQNIALSPHVDIIAGHTYYIIFARTLNDYSAYSRIYFKTNNITDGSSHPYWGTYGWYMAYSGYSATPYILFNAVPPPPPMCNAWTYGAWSACGIDRLEHRQILTSSPASCQGGMPYDTRNCTPTLDPQSDYWLSVSNPVPDSSQTIYMNTAGSMSAVFQISYVTPWFWQATTTRPDENIVMWQVFDKGTPSESYQLLTTYNPTDLDTGRNGKFNTLGVSIEASSTYDFELDFYDNNNLWRAVYNFKVINSANGAPGPPPATQTACNPEDSLFKCAIKEAFQQLFYPSENTTQLLTDIKNIFMGRWFFGYIQTGLDNIKTSYSSVLDDGAKAGIKYEFSLKGTDFDLGTMTILDTTNPVVQEYADLMRPYMIAILWIIFFMYVFWRIFYFEHM